MKIKLVPAIAVVEGLVLLLIAANALGLVRLPQSDLLSLCGGKIYDSAPSPDQKVVAYAFERDCGATTGFSSFVILKRAGEKLDLTEDLNDDEILFVADGDYNPGLQWTGQNELRVSFGPNNAPVSSDISLQTIKMRDYEIEYRGIEPSGSP